jgi:hypothetical protein
MHLRVITVFAKLLADVCFIYMVVNANGHIHQVLADDAEGKKNGQ